MSEASVEDALKIGMEHHRAGRFAEAEQIYRQIIAVEPRNGDAWHYLGVLAHQLGQYPQAEQIYRHLLEIHPSWPAPYIQLAETLLRWGRANDAIATCNTGVAACPTSAELNYALGSILQQVG